jgi:hypothetical protein
MISLAQMAYHPLCTCAHKLWFLIYWRCHTWSLRGCPLLPIRSATVLSVWSSLLHLFCSSRPLCLQSTLSVSIWFIWRSLGLIILYPLYIFELSAYVCRNCYRSCWSFPLLTTEETSAQAQGCLIESWYSSRSVVTRSVDKTNPLESVLLV